MYNPVKILDKIKRIGKNKVDNPLVYVVGGYVRDYLLNIPSDDIDIATNIPIDIIEKEFETHDIGKNKDFGIIVIKHNDHIYEIANFRSDNKYNDGRHPDSINVVNSFKKDSNRRDFTINAMAMDKDGHIIDYHNGRENIKNKTIRTVGNPFKRLNEDYLRMVRACRFAAKYNFKIEENTFTAIKENSDKIKNIAVERIMKEVYKCSHNGNILANFILLLKETGLLKYIFPEILELDNCPHCKKYHPEGNGFEHTIAALRKSSVDDIHTNMAILFHDIGKIKTLKIEDGKYKYHGHDKVGVDVFNKIADRMKLSNEMKDIIVYCIENHMKFHKFLELKKSTIFKIYDNKYFNILKEVSFCDTKSKNNDEYNNELLAIENKIKEINEKFNSYMKVKEIREYVNGYRIMSLRKDIKPGPKLGEIIKNTVNYVLDNELKYDSNEVREYILNYKRQITQRRWPCY